MRLFDVILFFVIGFLIVTTGMFLVSRRGESPIPEFRYIDWYQHPFKLGEQVLVFPKSPPKIKRYIHHVAR